MFACELANRQRPIFQHRNQLIGRRRSEIRQLVQRPARDMDSPNPPMHAVATLITKIDFAVLNDRVVPIGDIQRAVGAHPCVDRAKRDVAAGDNLRLLATSVGRRGRANRKSTNAMAAEIARHQITGPRFRKMSARNDF